MSRAALAVAVAAGVAAAGGALGLLVFKVSARGGLTDVSARPEFAAALAELASLDACEVEYGSPFIRGMNAEERKWRRLTVHDCSTFGDSVSLVVPEVTHSNFRLTRSSASAPWALLVAQGAVTPEQVSAALAVFTPVLLSQYAEAMARERAAMEKARRDLDARDEEAKSQREKNRESWAK